jgi:hypothetical protein
MVTSLLSRAIIGPEDDELLLPLNHFSPIKGRNNRSGQLHCGERTNISPLLSIANIAELI